MSYIRNDGGGNSNIRDGGYTSANIIGKMAPGHTLTLLSNGEYNSGYNWYIVDYNGQRGYVADTGGITLIRNEIVEVKKRLHWDYYGMNPVEYRWHSDMRMTIASKMPNTPYFFDNFARVGFDFFFCYGPYEDGHVYTPYPYAISLHGMTNGYYWNARDFGQSGYVEKYFDWRAECENKGGQLIYEHSGAPMKTPSGAARLPGVPENVNMTYQHLYTALKMGVCVYIRSWARTHSSGTSGGADGYIYSGYWDGVNNVPGSSHTFDNGLGISHPRCVVVQDSMAPIGESIVKAKLRVHGKGRAWNGKNCYVPGTKTVGNNVYQVAIMAAIQDEINGLMGNTPNANAGFDVPRGAKQIFRQDINCGSEAQDYDISFNPISLFGESKRGKRVALRVWYRYPDAYDGWNSYGPDYNAYRENMKIDGHIPFPSSKINEKPNFWLESSTELRKDNAAIDCRFLARGSDPEGQEYKTWVNGTFDTGGVPGWAPWREVRSPANNNHSDFTVDFKTLAKSIADGTNGITLAHLINKQVCTELFAFDGFSGSGVWQNCPTVNKWQSHTPRFDMRPENMRVDTNIDNGDVFDFTVNYFYPTSGCRHMLIISPEGSDGNAMGNTKERYLLGSTWAGWNVNLNDWSTSNKVTFDLKNFLDDSYRGKYVQVISGVISPYGWESTVGWNHSGVKRIRFNDYPVTKVLGVKVNNTKSSNNVKNLGTWVQTNRDGARLNLDSIIPGGYLSISGYMECTATADSEVTASLGMSYMKNNGSRDWLSMHSIKTRYITNNKTYFSGVFKLPDDIQTTLAYCWSQIGIPAGTAGYSVTFSDVKYNFFASGVSVPENYFNTGDIIDVSSLATDPDGIKNHIIGLTFEDGHNYHNKTITVTTDKNAYYAPNIETKSIITSFGLDYKTYVGLPYFVKVSATDKLNLAKDVHLSSNSKYEIIFDYKPGINFTLSSSIGTSTNINLSPNDYTAPRKYQIQVKTSDSSTWRTIYSSSALETRNIGYAFDPSAQGYTEADRGKVFNIRCIVISNTGVFESDWIYKDFTWGAAPTITLTSIDADYSIKDGVSRAGRFGTIATFNYTVSSSGPANITIQATINGTTKNILVKDVSAGTTTHSDRIDLKSSFSNVFCDYDTTFAIKGVAFGLTSVVNNTNDYGNKGKMVFLEPFNKGSITVTPYSGNSVKVSNYVHGLGFVLNTSSANSSYAKTRGVNMNKLYLYRGLSGTAEATKTLIATIEFNGNSVQALSNATSLLAEKCSMAKGNEYKFKAVIEVYYFQNSEVAAYTTTGDWTDELFRYTPSPTPAILVAPINAGISNNVVPCRRPTIIFTVPNQSEEGNKNIDVVEVKWNGNWVRSDSAPTRFDNLASNNAGRTIKFYPPEDSTNNTVDHGAQIAIRSAITKNWEISNVPLIMVDPQSVRKGVGTLIEIYSEPRDFINNLRRAYGLSNYNYPSLTAQNTQITRDNLINCLAIAQNEVATKINSYTGTKQIPAISYENLEYITSSQTDEVYTKLATFGTV